MKKLRDWFRWVRRSGWVLESYTSPKYIRNRKNGEVRVQGKGYQTWRDTMTGNRRKVYDREKY